MKKAWPNKMKITQMRIARPTNQLKKLEEFYCEGLGLEKIGSFQNHDGYDGLMIGLPDKDYHLEFTQHQDGSPCPAPTKDNLLVFYIPDEDTIKLLTARLKEMGYEPAPPENPYWEEKGLTIEDPDGWRIVLMNWIGIGHS
ncbi:VOC family protein [Metabacillus iocasae]|uniref:Glyoxalase superfamily protein PhnB n=1 Tax=Priestia iocasae TaxID=2291674 RepID=A0ABS2QVL9_9BACI|nr:VOC family protein [Metabacillus iocasae]MBM7703525.1 putative glyoxalase superfamily protein PhnB [Metabacillus iocasae]